MMNSRFPRVSLGLAHCVAHYVCIASTPALRLCFASAFNSLAESNRVCIESNCGFSRRLRFSTWGKYYDFASAVMCTRGCTIRMEAFILFWEWSYSHTLGERNYTLIL
ncbi:hypothetical protein ACS0PU_000739 [Formica fusca]